MPRPLTFHRRTVVERAMRAFWTHGYEATSLHDLLRRMQIKRSSLFNSFGSKRALFMEALRHYDTNYWRADIRKRLALPSPRRAIVDTFAQVLRQVAREDYPGCFLINTALDLSPHDAGAAAVVQEAFAYMERRFFRALLEKGRASGDIAKSVKPAATARVLLGLFIGMVVLARSHEDQRVLRSIVDKVRALVPSRGERE